MFESFFNKIFNKVFRPARLSKGTPTQVFSCEYCEIFKNTYFEEDLSTAASDFFTSEVIRSSLRLSKFH